VARAKRTDRAEARRRYRATLIDDLEPNEEDDSSSDEEAPSPASTARSRGRAVSNSPSGPPPRPSVIGALRAAFRPTDLRGDLAALPSLLRNRAFFIPLALIVGATALVLVTSGRDPLILSIVPYFLAPPPVAPVFLAGFLAPRASWLIGGLLGVVSQIAYVMLSSSPTLQPATGAPATAGIAADVLVYSSFVAIVGGAFYAAAAAWYKRFLALANPGRAARTTGKPADRSRRRSGTDDRPLLARRR
jgi:hypothetical protein